MPVAADSEPGPVSVHAGTAVEFDTAACIAIAGLPAAATLVLADTLSAATGDGVGAGGGGGGGFGAGDPPPPPPQADTAMVSVISVTRASALFHDATSRIPFDSVIGSLPCGSPACGGHVLIFLF